LALLAALPSQQHMTVASRQLQALCHVQLAARSDSLQAWWKVGHKQRQPFACTSGLDLLLLGPHEVRGIQGRRLNKHFCLCTGVWSGALDRQRS
jgi:hypothetical protein